MAVRVPGHVPLSAGIVNTSVPVGSAVALTTATTANVAQKALAAGTYLVWGTVDFADAAATVTLEEAGLTATSATMPNQAGPPPEGYSTVVKSIVTQTQTDQLDVRPVQITFASAATVFLVARATFSAGGVSAYGTLWVLPISVP